MNIYSPFEGGVATEVEERSNIGNKNKSPDIHIKGKGTITYAYDATGLKEAKTVVDSTQSPVKTTTTQYDKNFEYISDTLRQASVPDGRARWQKKYLLNGDSLYQFFFDYFLKDHLGDTRVILTTEKDTAEYRATMEAAYRTKENALFYNIDSTSYPTASVPGGYPTDNTTVPNDSVAMVEGNAGEHTQGPALLLKVMAGDSISIGVKSYYLSGGTAGNNSSSLNSVLNTLAGGLVALGGGGGHGTFSNLYNTSGSPVYNALNSNFYPAYDSTPGSKPKAYLNWMLLDNQFNYVSGNNQSGAIPVGSPNTLTTLATTIKLKHSGYLYIWVSNETQNWMVFFDNLSIEDFSGPMLEENHYYPFGLTMAGISDKAIKTSYAENKYRYTGKELQHQEFGDGTGLEEYDFGARLLDPQLGVWHGIDPLTDINKRFSPYSYAENNPLRFIDPDGMEVDNPDVAEDANSITFKGAAAQEVFKMLKEMIPDKPEDQEKDIRNMIANGNYQGALGKLKANPAFSTLLGTNASLFDIIPGSALNMKGYYNLVDSHTAKTGTGVTVYITEHFLDRFASNTKDPHPPEFDYLLAVIYHELVLGSGELKLNNIPDYYSTAMDEYTAYQYTAMHTNFNLSSEHRDEEFGNRPIHNIMSYNSADLIRAHLSEILGLLQKVSPATRAQLKQEIKTKFNISL